jgi:diguanylate cyclase (GGDEF)-like protein
LEAFIVQNSEVDIYSKAKYLLIFIVLPAVLFFISQHNYLLAHLLIEGWAIYVAFLVYVMAVHTYSYSRDDFLYFIGHAYLAVAVIDIMHTLAYKDMGLIQGLTANEPTQFWIAARYLEAFSFLAAAIFYGKKIGRRVLFPLFSIIVLLIVLSIMKWNIFPDCFIEGVGLTPFKVVSEYVISGILLFSLYILRKKANQMHPSTLRMISWAIFLTVISELLFTLYADVYGVLNFAGHLMKIASFYLIYEGVVSKGLQMPYQFIFEKLKRASISDFLSGLFNRQGFVEQGVKLMDLAYRNRSSFGIIMFDLDNFKKVNDVFGHDAGDDVIRVFANILNNNARDSDLVCRFGGDEFAILANVDDEGLEALEKRVIKDFCRWVSSSEYGSFLYISSGRACQKFDEESPYPCLDKLVKEADREMYIKKRMNHFGAENECSSRMAPELFLKD